MGRQDLAIFLFALLSGSAASFTPCAAASPDQFTQLTPSDSGAIPARQLVDRVQSYFAAFEKHADDPMFLLEDAETFHDWIRTRIAIERAIDAKESLRMLEPYGLTRGVDGSYGVDLQKFPQWRSLVLELATKSDPDWYEFLESELKARGFRDSDVVALTNAFEAAGDPVEAGKAGAIVILKQYSALLKTRPTRARSYDRDLAVAYEFQSNRAYDEARRQWALKVLNAIDAQPRRILLSFLLELPGSMRIMAQNDSEERRQELQQEISTAGP